MRTASRLFRWGIRKNFAQIMLSPPPIMTMTTFFAVYFIGNLCGQAASNPLRYNSSGRRLLPHHLSKFVNHPAMDTYHSDLSTLELAKSYGGGFLIRRKNQILFESKTKDKLVDVSESGKTVRRYVRI